MCWQWPEYRGVTSLQPSPQRLHSSLSVLAAPSSFPGQTRDVSVLITVIFSQVNIFQKLGPSAHGHSLKKGVKIILATVIEKCIYT